jgi:hypothetical protein
VLTQGAIFYEKSRRRDEEILEYLLSQGADLNKQNDSPSAKTWKNTACPALVRIPFGR